jgi:hypothetical protein
MDTAEFDLVKAISSAVTECVERGMQPPFTMCCVSQNGSVQVVRYTLADASRALDPSLIVNHEVPPGFTLPVNIMLVDRLGEAAHIRIAQSGTTFH